MSVPRASAEGSAELDARDVMGSGAHDQSLDRDTNLYVDVLNNTGDFATGNEKICWTGSGTLGVYPIGSNPWTGTPTALHTLTSGTCTSTALATVGQYPVRPSVDDQVVGTRWDIRVCDFDDACALDSANERTGRVWSRQWIFELGVAVYTQARANNGSVFAIVPGGDVGLDAVIEMTLDGVSGADYKLYANSIGPQVAADDTRVGRSVPRTATYEVIPELKLYLNAPETAQYNWREPEITSVEMAPSCGTGVVLDTASGTISFDSNVTGQYVVICDVDNDDIFDFASNTDFSSFGDAIIGNNVVEWDGKNNNGVNATAGTYDCVIRLNVGEFHYVGEDIETSFNGIRMFRVESNKTTRTPVNMFWDDGLITADAENMPAPVSRPAASEPEPDGLDPVGYMVAANAFRRSMAGVPSGNARAWGNFDADGKGNDAYLDTFSAADTAESPTFQISIITAAGDADTDALSNQRECAIGSDPQDDDSDDDGVNDGFEATNSTLPNSDSGVDAVPDVLDPDDDGDGIPTLTELGGENGDGNPTDAANSDGAGDGPDYLDIDSDDDGVDDADDVDPTDPLICRDTDGDSCDDCALTGDDGSGGDPDDDGTDTDGDGDCNDGSTGDDDDDNDGVNDGIDILPLNPNACRDADADACNDCVNTGADESGGDPDDDGLDTDGDGICNDGSLNNPIDGDPDDDNDGVIDAEDTAPLDPDVCRNTDSDSCDDCSITGDDESGGDPDNDGLDVDSDGICDLGELDTDGDGVPNPGDLDADNDGIPNADERDEDTDGDGLDNAVDLDSDGDGLTDILEGGGADLDDDEDGVIDELVDANTDGLHDPLQVSGDELPLPNSDEDSDPDFLDLDSDADGLLDIVEAGAIELDDNGNGRVDDDTDMNGNGLADEVDPDDGLATPGTPLDPPDSDSDGDDDFRDLDDDNDGISTQVELDDADEYGEDIDSDDKPNYLDTDTDDDGLLDSAESAGDGDANNNGVPDYIEPFVDEPSVTDDDADNDGLLDEEERDDGEDRDTDEDGLPDFEDPDDDGDGILTRDERPLGDTDGNGNPNYLQADDDGDGVLTRDERTDGREDIDTDDDGTPDHLDADDDDDGISTHDERAPASTDIDTDDDGDPNYLDPDDDNDGLLTRDERTEDGEDIDTDADAIPNHLDPDDDGDGIVTEEERTDDGEDIDTDDDGVPNHLDTDDDGDGIATDVEFSDGDDFGNDVDHDGIPNHLDPDSDGDGVSDADEAEQDENNNNVPDYLEEVEGVGGFAGGALCSISSAPRSSHGSMSGFGLLALALSTLVLRLRSSHKRSSRNLRGR